MPAIQKLLHELVEELPDKEAAEVVDFIEYLKLKKEKELYRELQREPIDMAILDVILENRDTVLYIIFSNFINKEFVHKEEVFEPFVTTSDTGESDANNIGLGLAIVKKIITMHGGRVALRESQENKFEIEIVLLK